MNTEICSSLAAEINRLKRTGEPAAICRRLNIQISETATVEYVPHRGFYAGTASNEYAFRLGRTETGARQHLASLALNICR